MVLTEGSKRWQAGFLMMMALWVSGLTGRAQIHVLDSGWHHLRNTGAAEWSTFPETADSNKLVIQFSLQPNETEHTLALRQADVKQNWNVILNGNPIGLLVADEKDLVHYLRLSPGALVGDNTLEISTTDKQPDDIRVGEIILYEQSPEQRLTQAHISLEVIDSDTQQRIPCRITVVDERGILQPVRALNDAPLAVRPGYVYTGNGRAVLGLPEGTFRVYVTRGFEYGVDSITTMLARGDHRMEKLYIAREVDTPGWVSCDPHIHTFTWSRHGDASALERVLTIAGEGIELPIITDHNVHADLGAFAADQHLNQYFTLMTGVEVTTRRGHFNVFPAEPESIPINRPIQNWAALARYLPDVRSHAIILNHARDVHSGFEPFDPKLHLAPAGMRLDKQSFPANALEVLNSSSQQTHPFQLMHDWFGLMNHGHRITPVGASDSHDVSRYFVGQARTFIRGNDDNPGAIDTKLAMRNFIEGNVMVSFGLIAKIEINDTYGPGELAPPSDAVKVAVEVSGPAWADADKITLYANGEPIREERITTRGQAGVKWSGEWSLTMPAHDVFLVAVAEGTPRDLPYWPVAKPVQPENDVWRPTLAGISGAVWLDADRNGKYNSSRDYAEAVLTQAGNDYSLLLQQLSEYPMSVAIQAAALLHLRGDNLASTAMTDALADAPMKIQQGFSIVIDALQASR